MGFFHDAVEGFVTGFTAAAIDKMRSGGFGGRSSQQTAHIERLCQQIGWAVDERENNAIILHFKDPLGIRRVIITGGEGGTIAMIAAYSATCLSGRQVPSEVLGYLLNRNAELVTGGWQASLRVNGIVAFGVTYCALLGGLDAAAFKFICEQIAGEAYLFDAKMQAAGLL